MPIGPRLLRLPTGKHEKKGAEAPFFFALAISR